MRGGALLGFPIGIPRYRAELRASVLVMCGNNRARKGAQVKSTSLGNPINITLRLFIFDLALLKFDKVEK